MDDWDENEEDLYDSDLDEDFSCDSSSEDDEEGELSSSVEVDAVITANGQFSNNLLSVITDGDPISNTVISPMSLSTILTLLKTGATGVSEKELGETLHLSMDANEINEGYQELLGSIHRFKMDHSKSISSRKNREFIVLLANRIYTDERYKLQDSFVQRAEEYFHSEIEKLDFSEPSATAAKISEWVSNSTNKKITNMVTEENINNDTVMVLVNVLYFKGTWCEYHTFSKSLTKEKPFHISKDETKMVQMMQLHGDNYKKMLFYTADDTLKTGVVRLDYTRGKHLGEHSMLIYLPNPDSSVENLVKSVDKYKVDVSSILAKMEVANVTLFMPKFKMEITHRLIPTLKKLGLNAIFKEETSELGNIGEATEPLYVTDIIQKVFIDVNEIGTEASAATKIESMCGSSRAPTPPRITVEFNVDRPFMFQIVNRGSGLVLFSGVCTDPTKSGKD